MTTPTEIVAAAIETHGVPKYVALVPTSVRRQVPADTMRSLLAAARISEGWARQGDRLIFGRLDPRETLRQWAQQHLYEVLTVREIAESADVSQSQVRTMCTERPDIFRKSDGRTYEIRDPHADRAAEKGR